MHAVLGVVSHGFGEESGQELGEKDLHFGPVQIGCHQFGKQLGRLSPHFGLPRTAELVQNVDERPFAFSFLHQSSPVYEAFIRSHLEQGEKNHLTFDAVFVQLDFHRREC